jgi:xanthine/CO dehydrogenase XdhC/CoxF family maturation factor
MAISTVGGGLVEADVIKAAPEVFRSRTAQEFKRVHSPIGTNIGAETPEEIGISIVGELIQGRAQRKQ